MIGDIQSIESSKYPRDVRKALNEAIKRLNRPTEIVFGDVESPAWDQGNNKEQIMLPISIKIPKGKKGDMLINDGSKWILLGAPPVEQTGENPALRFNRSTRTAYWETPGC